MARPLIEACLLGLTIGLLDVNTSGLGLLVFWVYGVSGAWLGFRHAGRSMWPGLILGTSLYPIHVAAIALGRQTPYVESSYLGATMNLIMVAPVVVGVALGAVARWAIDDRGRFRGGRGRPIRLAPATTRDWLSAIAGLCFGLGCIRAGVYPPTIYATGYVEARFRSIWMGMSAVEVEATAGPPIEKAEWSQEGLVNWIYSKAVNETRDYHRRWVFFKDGRVVHIISDYWYD